MKVGSNLKKPSNWDSTEISVCVSHLKQLLQHFYSPECSLIIISICVTGDYFRDLTLAVCVWEAPAHDLHSRPTCHLGIFDINCWYHSQMPPSIR